MRKLFAPAMLLVLPLSASASFHIMQIEQAIGGVAGDTTQQAVQLRMRNGSQNQVQNARLVLVDANGANPIVLIDFDHMVPNSALGDRVLSATANFSSAQGVTPDFTMVTIPSSYFAGGQIQFIQDATTSPIYSMCWGTYNGSTLGSALNDDNGVYGPCIAGPLPSADLSALLFRGGTAVGTTNANDYGLTVGAATFTNNARASVTIVEPPIFNDSFE